MLRRLGWPGFLLIGLVAGSAVGVTVAWAAFPFHPTPSTITACYPQSGSGKGQLRFIDYTRGARCHIGEAMLTWQRNVRWRGEWSAATDYSANDIVRYNGSAYVVLKDNNGVPPSDGSTFALLVARGDPGDPGASGLPGAPGRNGARGPSGAVVADTSAGVNGVTGATGAVGATGAAGSAGTDRRPRSQWSAGTSRALDRAHDPAAADRDVALGSRAVAHGESGDQRRARRRGV